MYLLFNSCVFTELDISPVCKNMSIACKNTLIFIFILHARFIDFQSRDDLELVKDAERLGQYASQVFVSSPIVKLLV